MLTRRSSLLLLLAVVALASAACAQQEKEAPNPAPAAAAPQLPKPAPAPAHRFWDKENSLLFAGVGGARALDYASTLYMRDHGVNETLLSNDIVDNRPLFAGIEAAGTAASIGVAYLFHRTGHHKLERWVSIVHIGVGTGGAIRNFTLP